MYRQAAIEMARSQPAEAERFFGLIEERTGYLDVRDCDPALPPAGGGRSAACAADRGCDRNAGGPCLSLGVYCARSIASVTSKRLISRWTARSRRSIAFWNPGRASKPVTNLDGVLTLYPSNPAAVILPVVELVAPERLAEFFWRAVALHERVNVDEEDALQRSAIGVECLLLSRYDRQVAALLFEPMDSFIKSVLAEKEQTNELTSSVIMAKACIDPNAAVELLEALPVAPGEVPFNEARMRLAHAFSGFLEKSAGKFCGDRCQLASFRWRGFSSLAQRTSG